MKYFSKRRNLLVHGEKRDIVVYVLNFKEEVVHEPIRLYCFSMHHIENQDAYTKFIEEMINAQIADHLNDPELFELVKTCKCISILELAGNTARMAIDCPMVFSGE